MRFPNWSSAFESGARGPCQASRNLIGAETGLSKVARKEPRNPRKVLSVGAKNSSIKLVK